MQSDNIFFFYYVALLICGLNAILTNLLLV